MAKKPDKTSTSRKKNNVGCLSGLIRLFHFGKARFTRKLLSDGKERISDKSGHGGTTNAGNKTDLPSNTKEKHESIDLGVCTNVSEKDGSNKDCDKEEIHIKHTAEIISGYDMDIKKKSKTVTSHDNKSGTNSSNQDSMVPQSLWSDLMVEICKEKNVERNEFGKHGDALGKIPSNMIIKYFDPKQIQASRFNPKIPSSHALQHIVVLKPNKQHEETGHSSRFTLKEIKRMMKGIKSEGKIKPSSIAMDSLLHKIPYGSPKSIEENEKKSTKTKLATLLQRYEEEPNLDNSRESVSYDEARKRLADMLRFDDRVNKISSPRQPLKSLGRILSLPGFDSPSPLYSSRFSSQINDSSPIISMNLNPEAAQPKAQFDTEDGLKGKDYTDDWIAFSTDELGCDSERCNDEETQSISDSSMKALDITANNQQNDSILLSAVEHVPDDDELISKQKRLKYLRSVFEGSGLDYTELLDQLQDPSVFDELEIKYGQLNTDSNIFLDYIDEVFVEICMKFSHSTTSWISFIKPNIRPTPTKEFFMHELCERVERVIHKDIPYSLEHITEIDLEHEVWQNIRLDIEDVVIEIGDVILDYIMEETVLELSNSIQVF